ncbi:MAG: YbaB/EbfC family nucleoid-associated protein [Thermoguttaceae bacterium]|nr:YbaB/EbfC family nucleoid-associated protein [Thermoguttaceae bacterium]MDW8078020.1 YbaB/EbfC family nucleoid-associated protein [Thermoguttaceae bacterium]
MDFRGHWFFNVFESLGQQREVLQKAAAVYERFSSLRRNLRKQEVVGSAGAGLVEVEMNALGEAIGCKIDPELLKVDEKEFLEGLLVEAINAALKKAAEAQVEAMKKAAKELDFRSLQPFLQGLFGSPSPPADPNG